LSFIDLEKAYDRCQEVLWWTLMKKGVPIKYIDIIKDLYDKVWQMLELVEA